ncbi:MAG: hypothetical protein LBE20_04865 [Deltaproteobacteria bacterium]|jgi:hypothetical protein|nr:hypothetical protein [Deltaproteobacteria bacterium]
MLALFNLYLQQLAHEIRNSVGVVSGVINDQLEGLALTEADFLDAKSKLEQIKQTLEVLKLTTSLTDASHPNFEQLKTIILNYFSSKSLAPEQLQIQTQTLAQQQELILSPLPKLILNPNNLEYLNLLLIQKLLLEQSIKFEFQQIENNVVIKFSFQ